MVLSGFPGKIQLAPSTDELIREHYAFESRGSVQPMGKAPMTNYLCSGAVSVPDRRLPA